MDTSETLVINSLSSANPRVRRSPPPPLRLKSPASSMRSSQNLRNSSSLSSSPTSLAPPMNELDIHIKKNIIASDSSDSLTSLEKTVARKKSHSVSSKSKSIAMTSNNTDELTKRIAAVISGTTPPNLSANVHPAVNEKKYRRRTKKTSSHAEVLKTAASLRQIAKKIGRAQLVWEAPPKTVLIVTKFWDAELVRLTHAVAKWLINIGMTVLVENRLKDDPNFDYEHFDSPESDSEQQHHNGGSESSEQTLATSPTHALSSSESSTFPEPSSSVDAVLEELVESPTVKSKSALKFWDPKFCSECTTGSEIDFIITLGGDGTVLFAAWLFQNKVPPIIPFHLGSLGFLTVFDFTQFRSSIKRILESESGVRMNFRMRFACTILRNQARKDLPPLTPAGLTTGAVMEEEDHHGKTYNILNDLVVDRGPSPYMSQLEVYGNDKHLTTVQADGLVVGTPTGSTAYSLSAGGSVLHPDVSAMLISPICPHTLSFRPMILPDTMELRIEVPSDSRATAWASFDGRLRVQLQQGDAIRVVASNYPVPTVCARGDQSADWFEGLERCLGWNRRERQKAFDTEAIEKKGTKLKEDEW